MTADLFGHGVQRTAPPTHTLVRTVDARACLGGLDIASLPRLNIVMTKPMKYGELADLLRNAGFTGRPGKGDHEVWRNGQVTVTIVTAREVSPAVVRDALKAIERSEA